ncbi:hypothetical protein OIU77_013780 [Salix suchowensis]|uniref:PUB 62/63 C-terminal domain-containing protein n=1 Tax=Salix suchowensis TaxID=1278906 RepID=A0ABQ8ZVT8_9ROSI|nr:hypothetical protein OIU77_013780 [Salix suchowensis]
MGLLVGPYLRAVEALAGSLMRHNAAVIELGGAEASLMRCGLEAARLYFRSRSQNGVVKGCSNRGIYMYRAGRPVEDWDSSPPCMAEIFRCMGKAARSALCAIARHLRLRSDVFSQLLDDTPLPAGEVSSSVLVATYSHTSLQNGKGAIGGGKLAVSGEVEKGLLTLISSDSPGLQVCDPNGHWFLADCSSAPGDLLLITGKTLSHTTAGLRPAASYRAASDHSSGANSGGRTSLAFRLMPQGNAILDCSPIAAAGHVIPPSYVPISVSQFMDDLSAEEDVNCNRPDNTYVAQNDVNKEPSLRSVLSDPHIITSSLGALSRIPESLKCQDVHFAMQTLRLGSLVPNYALRAAAAAVKNEDDRRLFYNATLRKRRKEMGDHTNSMKRQHRENGGIAADDGLQRGVQYPFSVNERVMIKGNRRTPEKFVGKEAIITSQCLNGWYLLKIIGSGEDVRLQYRSLRKILSSEAIEDRCASQPYSKQQLIDFNFPHVHFYQLYRDQLVIHLCPVDAKKAMMFFSCKLSEYLARTEV